MKHKRLKVIALLLTTYVAFLAYQYHFGSMYEGKQYQRKTFEIAAKSALERFYQRQKMVLEKDGRYDPTLHLSPEFTDIKNVVLGYRDHPKVMAKCFNCTLTNIGYKIAAYSKHDVTSSIWTINTLGELVQIQ